MVRTFSWEAICFDTNVSFDVSENNTYILRYKTSERVCLVNHIYFFPGLVADLNHSLDIIVTSHVNTMHDHQIGMSWESHSKMILTKWIRRSPLTAKRWEISSEIQRILVQLSGLNYMERGGPVAHTPAKCPFLWVILKWIKAVCI